VEELRERFGEQQATSYTARSEPVGLLRHEDLELICFDFISGG